MNTDPFTQNQNNEVQVFIIKQIERQDKIEFVNKYHEFISGLENLFHQNLETEFLSLFKNRSSVKSSYLVPLIDDCGNYKDLLKQNDDYTPKGLDACYYNFKEINKKNKEGKEEFSEEKIDKNNFYVNTRYQSILKCPLLDFTKLAYIFQTSSGNGLSCSDVISFTTNFSTNGPSSCNITLNNFDYKYNFVYNDLEKDLNNHEDLYKSVFDTEDIVIIRMAKRADKDYTKAKFDDPYASFDNGKMDYFQTVFTGYINNVNESINWQSKSQTVTLSCSGPSKRISYKRLITGQATVDQDAGSAIVPMSCYSIPQATNSEGKYSLKNKEIIKNVIVRTLTSIDNIPDCMKAKLMFEIMFTQNAGATVADTKIINQVNFYKNEYNKTVNDNFKDFCITNKDENNVPTTIEIYKNIFKAKAKDVFLPIFKIIGTNQQAVQYDFNSFNNMFVANYDTVYQFIKKIAEKLHFVFYDDPYGVIHFELIDTDISHLYDENDPNNFTQVISFNKEQNTDNITNIMSVATSSEFAGILEGQALGLLAVVRDTESIKKYGERPMSPFNVIGLTDKKACERYGKDLMGKMTRKINSYQLSMIGDPSIKLGKYAYMKDLRKLFYVESVRHQYTAGSSLISTVTGSYERRPLADVLIIENPYKNLKIVDKKDKEIDAEGKTKRAQFLQIRSVLNERLSKIDPKTYVNDITTIWENAKCGDIATNLIHRIINKSNFVNINEADVYKLYKVYAEINIPFLYLDGFFWEHPFESDLFQNANVIQEEKRKEKEQKNKDKQEAKKVEEKKKTKDTKTSSKKTETKKEEPKEDKPQVVSKSAWPAYLAVAITKAKEVVDKIPGLNNSIFSDLVKSAQETLLKEAEKYYNENKDER